MYVRMYIQLELGEDDRYNVEKRVGCPLRLRLRRLRLRLPPLMIGAGRRGAGQKAGQDKPEQGHESM